MSEDRCSRAVARIEAALDRIAAHRSAAPAPSAAPADPRLAERHERLRQATRSAIAELDALIEAR